MICYQKYLLQEGRLKSDIRIDCGQLGCFFFFFFFFTMMLLNEGRDRRGREGGNEGKERVGRQDWDR